MKMLKRILAVALVLTLLLPMLPHAAAAEDDLKASVEEQIRAFADSIDQPNADDDAALALAGHGMSGRGKKFSVGKNHALTATLLNSELAQNALIDSCEAAIRSMQQLDLQKLENIMGAYNWYGTEDSSYYTRVYDSTDSTTKAILWELTKVKDYTGPRNSYDEALDWIAGFSSVYMTVERIKVTADAATYRVNLTIKDRFDFAISGNELFKDLISGIGALLFREFDWESKVTFDLTVPYACYHETRNYRFTYDAESKTMTADSTGGWQANDITRLTYTAPSGAESYYHELEETVRLRHDAPWVMEFDVRKPNTFAFSPLRVNSYAHHVLLNNGRALIAAAYYERVTVSQEIADEYDLSTRSQTIRHNYGTKLSSMFKYSSQKIYTIRLENEPHADGSNMIYLTAWETETGKVELERIPMDDYYIRESWLNELQLRDLCDEWVSRKDLIINCIGYTKYRFDPDYFELRVWENGENGEPVSYYQDKVTAPTCEAKGYTTHTCTICGYAYKGSYVPAVGHSFGEWSQTAAPGCTEAGEESRSCATCGKSEVRSIPATGHNYESVDTPPTCTEQGCTTHTCKLCGDSYMDSYVEAVGHSWGDWVVTKNPTTKEPGQEQRTCSTCGETESREIPMLEFIYGDANGDSEINGKDLILLRQYLADWDVELEEAAADCNGDGKVNGKDLILLRQYLADWDVTLG